MKQLKPDPTKSVYVEWPVEIYKIVDFRWSNADHRTRPILADATETRRGLWSLEATAENIAAAERFIAECHPDGGRVLLDAPPPEDG